MPSLALEPRRLVQQQPSGLEPHFHVGNPVGDGGVFSNWLPELLALARILDAGFNQSLHHAEMAGQDAGALPLHRVSEDRLPAAFFAQNVSTGSLQSTSATSDIGDVRSSILCS